MCFLSSIELVNQLEHEKLLSKLGRTVNRLIRTDLVVLDELGYLPFSHAGSALPLHLISKPFERTCIIITANFSIANDQMSLVMGKITTALLDRVSHHCKILETGNDSYRFKHASTQARKHASSNKDKLRNKPQPDLETGQLLMQMQMQMQGDFECNLTSHIIKGKPMNAGVRLPIEDSPSATTAVIDTFFVPMLL